MSEHENRGGKRPGAGRPAGEKTVQMRIPEGAVELVRSLVDDYKSGLKSTPEIKREQVDWVEELKPAPEIKKPGRKRKAQADALKNELKIKGGGKPLDASGLSPDAAEALRVICAKSTRRDRRAMVATYGSLQRAAEYIASVEAGKLDKTRTKPGQ